jgi:hypothetical protein
MLLSICTTSAIYFQSPGQKWMRSWRYRGMSVHVLEIEIWISVLSSILRRYQNQNLESYYMWDIWGRGLHVGYLGKGSVVGTEFVTAVQAICPTVQAWPSAINFLFSSSHSWRLMACSSEFSSMSSYIWAPSSSMMSCS